jgi:hypothetical protein
MNIGGLSGLSVAHACRAKAPIAHSAPMIRHASVILSIVDCFAIYLSAQVNEEPNSVCSESPKSVNQTANFYAQ